MSKRFSIVIIAGLCLLSCYLYYSYMRLKADYISVLLTKEILEENLADEGLNIPDSKRENTGEKEPVLFYICGEVNAPDVYELPKGSRITDAIEAAGGHTEDAALEMMESLAAEITDGQKIYVPNIADDIDKINYMNNNNSRRKGAAQAKNPDVVININTAGIDELCLIPGIGEATAKLILDYRQENGDFVTIEDIKNVPRIGDKTFESIKKNITVN